MKSHILTLALMGSCVSPLTSMPTQASPLGITASAIQADDGLLERVAVRGGRGGMRAAGIRRGGATWRGRGAIARRGGVAALGGAGALTRPAVLPGWQGGIARPGWNGAFARPGWGSGIAEAGWAGRPGWNAAFGSGLARPASYWWRPGGALAAGAAIGFVTAASAAAFGGQAPGPNMCWYYTDSAGTQGFWDQCQ
jgi:hypothetical protein